MRNWRLVGAGAMILTALLVSPAVADPIIGTTSDLKPANPSTVEAWLETLLGGKNVHLVYDYQAPAGTDVKIVNFNPGVSWDYAVVKFANYYNAYSDTNLNDNLLIADSNLKPLSNGVSNIRYFAVPEPSVLLLLGAGLVAAAPFLRSRRRTV